MKVLYMRKLSYLIRCAGAIQYDRLDPLVVLCWPGYLCVLEVPPAGLDHQSKAVPSSLIGCSPGTNIALQCADASAPVESSN